MVQTARPRNQFERGNWRAKVVEVYGAQPDKLVSSSRYYMEYVAKFLEWPDFDQLVWFMKDKVRRPGGIKLKKGREYLIMEHIETLPSTIKEIVEQEIKNFAPVRAAMDPQLAAKKYLASLEIEMRNKMEKK